jgi:hypothetical protein
MATNPNYERKKEIETAVLDTFAVADPAQFFPPHKISDGKQILQKKFALMPHVPKNVAEIVSLEVDKFNELPGYYRVPRRRIDIEMRMDEYRTIMGGGEYAGLASAASKAMLIAKWNAICRASPISTGQEPANAFPYYGLIDAGTGNGTPSRPLVTTAPTKAGAWSTATYAANDLAGLVGSLETHYAFSEAANAGKLLLYPAVVATRWNALVPDQTGQVVFVKELRDRLFERSAPVPDTVEDIATSGATAVSCLTGAAETATNFEMVACIPSMFLYVYDRAPSARLWVNESETAAYLSLEDHGGIIPIPIYETDSKWYKACTYIDTCGA